MPSSAEAGPAVPPVLDVRELVLLYGPVRALDGLSFSLSGPGMTGLVGPNGAGKTTTMRIVAGLLLPHSGEVRIHGRLLGSSGEDPRRHIGYLPERVPLYPELTVREHLTHLGLLRGIGSGRIASRVDAALEDFGLGDLAARRVGGLSAGQRQRAALASALVHEPSLIVLDEPTAHLDPGGRREVLDLLVRRASSSTILMSSHLLAEVEDVCSRVLILEGGRLTASLATSELVARARPEDGIVLTLRGPSAEVRELLESLYPCVEPRASVLASRGGSPAGPVQAQGEEGAAGASDDGWELGRYVVRGHAPAPQVARALVDRGWELLELRPLRSGLPTQTPADPE